MRVVVTGASGNVGSQVVEQLLAHPAVSAVVGIARRPPVGLEPAVQWHALDLAVDDLRPALRGADAVVHLAWLLQPAHHPDRMAQVNLGGTSRLLDAIHDEAVPVLVHASSVGAYSPGPKHPRVDEAHPTGGIASSTYSQHKSQAEALLDSFGRSHPDTRIVRIRAGIVLQASAASELARYFLGPFVPQRLLRRSLLPVVPRTPGLVIQAVHARDLAAAYVSAVTEPVHGAFNVAAEPVLDVDTIGAALQARPVPVPQAVLRGLVEGAWRLRLIPTDPGWLDLAVQTPLMDTSRARKELHWSPSTPADAALRETLDAMSTGAGGASQVLRPRATGLQRLAEVIRGVTPGAGGTG